MEEKGKVVKKTYWLLIMIVQSVVMIGVMIWAITQKVEAEKQHDEVLKQREIAETAQKEAIMYRKIYEEILKNKK